MIPAIQKGDLIKAWLAGFLSSFDSEDVVDLIAEVCQIATGSSAYNPQNDENAYETGILAYEAGFETARKMVDGDQIYDVCISHDDTISVEPGSVQVFWFVGKNEQAVIDSLKAVLAPTAVEVDDL